MNDNTRLSRAGTQSSPSSARRCAGPLPLLIFYRSSGLNPIPIEDVQWMISESASFEPRFSGGRLVEQRYHVTKRMLIEVKSCIYQSKLLHSSK